MKLKLLNCSDNMYCSVKKLHPTWKIVRYINPSERRMRPGVMHDGKPSFFTCNGNVS